MVMKISASLQSTCSLKSGYFSQVPWIIWLRLMSYSRSSLGTKWVLPKHQAFSNRATRWTSSGLFVSWGSTTSTFSAYLSMNRFLRLLKLLVIWVQSYLTAALWLVLILLATSSATSRTETSISSLPCPMLFATLFISLIYLRNLFRRLVYSSSVALSKMRPLTFCSFS